MNVAAIVIAASIAFAEIRDGIIDWIFFIRSASSILPCFSKLASSAAPLLKGIPFPPCAVS